jgi:Fur family transcriptional regulator, ferric uptake regulator
MSCQEKTRKSIRNLGLRMTSQREFILEILHHAPASVSAQMILGTARSQENSLDLTTVYRTLELFERFGLVVSYDAGHDSRRYLYTGGDGQQPRLVCTSCGAITNLEKTILEQAIGKFPKTNGWKVNAHAAVITGMCAECCKQAQS